ncbi:hypothetical protein [Ilumatobacter sp.]|uniref:hypothetical protein n=1 Tax=Ilumatobacter sp. TaxID=1967498 RepID=UPI003C41A364
MTDETSADASTTAEFEVSPIVHEPPSSERAMPWERIDWVACAVLTTITIIVVGLHVRAYPTLSPIDELQHIDYVIKAGDLDFPHGNDLVGQEALEEAACRGVDVSGYQPAALRRSRVITRPLANSSAAPGSSGGPVESGPPVCGNDLHDPADFQENGVNTAARQFPPYYLVTGVASRAVAATGIVGSQVTAARVVGGLWAGAAWSVMWYAMSLLGVRRRQRAVALALLIATPLTLFHAATVNVDAVLMLTGALALVATLKFEAGRLRGALLMLVYFGLYLVEPTVFLAICASAAYLLARVTPRPDVATWKRILPLTVFPLVLALRLWFYRPLQQTLAPDSPVTNRPTMYVDNALPTGGIDWSNVLAQLDANFLPITKPYIPPFLDEPWTDVFIHLANWFLIGTLLIAAFRYLRDDRVVWLARAAIVTLLASGPFYTWSFAYFSEANFAAPGRFALPMIVFIAVVGAAAMRTRSAFVVGAVVAAGSLFNTVYLLATP